MSTAPTGKPTNAQALTAKAMTAKAMTAKAMTAKAMTAKAMTAKAVTAKARLRLVRLGVSDEYEPRQIAVAAVATIAPVLFACCLMLGGGDASWWWLLFAAAGLATVAYAETPAALIMWAMLITLWVAQVPGPFTWWSAPGAMCVAAGHTALTLLAGRPAAGGLAAATFRRASRRLGVVAAVVLGVAVLTQVVHVLGVRGQLVLAVPAVLVVAAWVWWGWRQDDAAKAS